MACGAASEGSEPSRRRKPLTRSAARVIALFPFAMVGGCGRPAPALPTNATSNTTPVLPGTAEFDGAASSMGPLATTSLLVPLCTVEGEDGPDFGVVAPALALTDAGAKPR